MDFKTYQKKARETAQYPDLGSNNIYPTLGLVGEAGEVAEKVKKVIRDKNGIFDNESKLGIKKRVRRCFVVYIKSLHRIKFQFRGCCITKP